MRTRLPMALAALSLSACHHPLVRTDAREANSLRMMDESPLLLELPEDPPAPELHEVAGSLRIADDTPHSLIFRGAPLRAALADIASRAEITLLVDEAVTGQVDADFQDISLDDTLTTLLTQNDLVLLPGPGKVWFVERNDDPTMVTEFIQLANVRAADVSANIEAMVTDGSRVITDVDRNLICVIGRQSDVGAVRRYLHHVDTLKDQVLLEVHIFEASYEDGFNLGAVQNISETLDGDALDLMSNFGQGSEFSAVLTDSAGRFASTIDAIRSHIGLELISCPRVLAVTNTLAVVDVVQEVPYIETTSTTTGTTAGVGSTIQEAVQFKEAGIKLEITPSIQEAGFLQISINQLISEEVDRFNDIPVIDKRTLTTQFIVQDRNTIVLGGLIQKRHVESRRGVPILMHIPLLGQLFRSDADRKENQEILVFVTPRILSPRQAALLAPHYEESYLERRRDLTFPTLFGSDD